MPNAREIIAINSPFAFETNLGRKFTKEVVVEGKYVHPQDYKTRLDITVDRMKEWVKNFQKKLVDIVYVPLNHSSKPTDNTGVIENIYIGDSQTQPGKKALYALFDIRLDEVAEKIGKTILGDSIGIETYLDPVTGENKGEILSHIALTNEPFMQGLGEFKMAFSQEDAIIKPFTFQAEQPKEEKPKAVETVKEDIKMDKEMEALKAKMAELEKAKAELEKAHAEDSKAIELAKAEKEKMEKASFEKEITSEIEKLVLSKKVMPADKDGEVKFAISLGREKGIEYVSRLAKKADVVDTSVISTTTMTKPDSTNAEKPKLSELNSILAEAIMYPHKKAALMEKWNVLCEKTVKAGGFVRDIPLVSTDGKTMIEAERK